MDKDPFAKGDDRRQIKEVKRRGGNRSSGLTFFEVIIVMAIGLLLMAISAPHVAGVLQSASVATQAHEFLSNLNYARSEAIKRNQRITICKSADGVDCVTSGNWDQGWIIFVDVENTGQVADAAYILKRRIALDGGSTLVGNTPVRNYISYVGKGTTLSVTGAFQAGTLTLCRQARGIKIVIARTGRVRTDKTTCI
ncbi:GspH/FimT family pseudopilin [Desulfonatronum parangueonense]